MSEQTPAAEGATPEAAPTPAPEAGATPTTPEPAAAPEAPAELGDAGKAALDAERKARRDAEKRVKALEAAEKARAEAEMSELEKAQARLAELEKANQAAEARAAEAAFERAIVAAAAAHNLADPADAIALLANRREELLETDGAVDAAIKQIAEAKPYLLKASAPFGGNPTSPGRRDNAPKLSDAERLHQIQHGSPKPWYEGEGAGVMNAATGDFTSLAEIRNRAG